MSDYIPNDRNVKKKSTKAYVTTSAVEPLKEMVINRRQVQVYDVEFEILYCGICHCDLHQIKDNFGGTMFQIVPGHEMVERVTAVGEHVTDFKVGELAAVGCIVEL